MRLSFELEPQSNPQALAEGPPPPEVGGFSPPPSEGAFGPMVSLEPMTDAPRKIGDYSKVRFRVADKITAAKEAQDAEAARREAIKIRRVQSEARFAEYKMMLDEARRVMREPLPKMGEFQADEADLIAGGLATAIGLPADVAAGHVSQMGEQRRRQKHQEALADFELRRGAADSDMRMALEGSRFEQNLMAELDREDRLRENAVADRELAWTRHLEEIDRENGEWRARAQISFGYDQLGREAQATIGKELAEFEAELREKYQVRGETRADERAEIVTYRGALVDAESEQSVRGAIEGLRKKGVIVPPTMASAFVAAGRKKDELRQQQVNLEVLKTNAQIKATEAGIVNDNRRMGLLEEEFINEAGAKGGVTRDQAVAELRAIEPQIKSQRKLLEGAKARRDAAAKVLKKNSFDEAAKAEHRAALEQMTKAEASLSELESKWQVAKQRVDQMPDESSGLEGRIGDARVRVEENRARSGMKPFKMPGFEDGAPNAELESDRKAVLERIRTFKGNPAKQAEYRKWFKDKYGVNP